MRGTVLGYRDFAGREAQPGTYDTLSHMLFEPPPMPGCSGGPIVDEESGAVVGIMLGSRMDNRAEGLRGWGVPSEAVYEVTCYPRPLSRIFAYLKTLRVDVQSPRPQSLTFTMYSVTNVSMLIVPS